MEAKANVALVFVPQRLWPFISAGGGTGKYIPSGLYSLLIYAFYIAERTSSLLLLPTPMSCWTLEIIEFSRAYYFWRVCSTKFEYRK